MAGFLRRFFSVPGERSSRDIILWWEKRRLVYNAVLFVCGFFSAVMIFWLRPCFEPLMLLFGLPIFFIGANVCYTAGWVFELIVRRFDPERKANRGLAKVLLIMGFSTSIIIAAGPGLMDVTGRIIVGPSYRPTATLTNVEPRREDLVGRYAAIGSTRRALRWKGFSDEAAYTVVLDSNGRAAFQEMPYDASAISSQYLLVTDSGRWELIFPAETYDHHWVVQVEFPRGLRAVDSTLPEWQRHVNSYTFMLRNDEPPYELFDWAGEPDCDWVVYRQQPSKAQ